MHAAQSAAAVAAVAAVAELRIQINLDHWIQFEGSAAQLVAEGLIPDGFEWPSSNDDVRWQTNGFHYWLRRTRPEGHKGPMRSWLALDNWFVRVTVNGRYCSSGTRRALELKAEALRIEFHEQTPAGQRERHAASELYWKARRDSAFQAFKALIPGLVPPKRGRKPKHGLQGSADVQQGPQP